MIMVGLSWGEEESYLEFVEKNIKQTFRNYRFKNNNLN